MTVLLPTKVWIRSTSFV